MMHSPAESLARRQIERQIIEDGTAIWKTKKDIDNQLALEERRQSRNQNFFSEGDENNSEFDFCDHKKQLREMLATYHPWGKPGNGAPMPGALRKTKWITEEAPSIEHTPTSAMTLGRPGHGAPLRTKSGKTKTGIKTDPFIRFQFQESARKSVDNDLRYRASPSDKENYRKQLDALVYEKKRAKSQESGGAQRIERNKKGWTNDVMFRRLEKELPESNSEQETMYEISGGGVELVPLLARHRMVHRCPLSTTDVTRMSKVPNGPPKPPMTEHEYFHELGHQVHEKHHMEEEARRDDLVTSQKHFETWKGYWGRPGHGAPKVNEKSSNQREKLEVILYHMPSQNVCPGMQNMIH